jgi:hypothetical protein
VSEWFPLRTRHPAESYRKVLPQESIRRKAAGRLICGAAGRRQALAITQPAAELAFAEAGLKAERITALR